MKFRRVLSQRACYGIVGILYLSLSFYSVLCVFHHDIFPSSLNADDHHHGGKHNEQRKSALGDALCCKLVQKIDTSVIAVSKITPSSLNFTTHEVIDHYSSPVYLFTYKTNLSRGPPVVLS